MAGHVDNLFREFCQASDAKDIISKFKSLCGCLKIDINKRKDIYTSFRSNITGNEAKHLWTCIDNKAKQDVLIDNRACQGKQVSPTEELIYAYA